MRCLVVAAVLLAVALPVVADPPNRRAEVDAIVPVPPYEHERLHYFGRRYHHLVPGTVTIGKTPYVCDLDEQLFRTQDDFVAHLRTVHRVPPESIPDRLLVDRGEVHFLGD